MFHDSYKEPQCVHDCLDICGEVRGDLLSPCLQGDNGDGGHDVMMVMMVMYVAICLSLSLSVIDCDGDGDGDGLNDGVCARREARAGHVEARASPGTSSQFSLSASSSMFPPFSAARLVTSLSRALEQMSCLEKSAAL